MYMPQNWYWIIGEDQTSVWSSARATAVPVDDADYVAWLVAHGVPTPIATKGDLQVVLAEQYPPGMLETYCISKRWQKEQAGITLTSGMPIKTDDRSQAKITGAYAAAQAMPTVTTMWQAADGSVHALDATQIIAMNEELLIHIDDCFAISAQVLTDIAAGTITTREQIDAAFAGAPAKSAAQRGWKWPN
jgi:hypothetical protein